MSASRLRRDAGMTLTEVIVAVVMTGLLTGVLAAAITTVLRSDDGVARAVGESHDLQQVVNYLPSDVRVATTDPAAYTTDGVPACGSGTNVLSISHPDGSSVSYVLASSGASLDLDRVVCDSAGGTSHLNVADLLDPAIERPAVADVAVDGGRVRDVSLRLVRLGGQSSVVTAVPRSSEVLAEAYVVGGQCGSNDPTAATLGFLTFVEGDAWFEDDVEIYQSAAIGGTLTFDDGEVAAHRTNNSYQPASIGLYVGAIDWDASDGTLTVHGEPNGHVVIVDQTEGVDIETDRKGSTTYISEYRGGSKPRIEAEKGQLKEPNPGHAVQFATAFTELRSCSEAMAQLPAACDGCAAHVVPLHINANRDRRDPYLGQGDVRLDLTDGVTNVLNVGEARLATIGGVTPAYLDATPSDVDALVINVIDDDPSNDVDGRSVVVLDDVLRFQNHTTKVIWNFAGIDEVRLPRGLWGTVYAPFSTVVVDGDVQGDLIAASVILEDGVINEDRSFEGEIRWS